MLKDLLPLDTYLVIRISPFYNLLSFFSQMAGDKRKGKVVAEPKKKKTRQEKEWDHVLSMLDTQGQPQRGIQIGESAQGQGEQPQGEQQQQFRRSGRGQQSAK
jgi:hypothetical protein